ncbi:hypothetical protein D3C72_776570 [compost metagenome]
MPLRTGRHLEEGQRFHSLGWHRSAGSYYRLMKPSVIDIQVSRMMGQYELRPNLIEVSLDHLNEV